MTALLFACLSTSSLRRVVPQPTVAGLRCEYLVDPIGIDDPSPRLSWTIAYPGRDWRQSAYRITVGSSRVQLEGKPDLWDTGKVNSGTTTQIPYQGKVLTSGKACFWRVEVWDQDGITSEWSKPGSWQMGLLNEDA